MKHINSHVVIHTTTSYEKFAVIIGNRGINIKKIDRIITEIENGNDILNYCPVLVNERDELLHILDGQHRFMISKKLKRPVNYIIVPEKKSMVDIASVNSNVEKWKTQDFLNCYITQGNEHYIKLQAFINKYGFAVGTCVILLETGSPVQRSYAKADVGQEFHKGLFEVKFEKKATELAELCQRFSAVVMWKDRSFIQAIDKIQRAELVEMEVVIAAVNKFPHMLTKHISSKNMLYNLEQIVNNGKQKRVIIS